MVPSLFLRVGSASLPTRLQVALTRFEQEEEGGYRKLWPKMGPLDFLDHIKCCRMLKDDLPHREALGRRKIGTQT